MSMNDRAINRTQASLITLQAAKIAELETMIDALAQKVRLLEAKLKDTEKADAVKQEANC